MKKKGSLSLSVNAIVVFVLAFAMLGVGLFVTNMIKDYAGGAVSKSFASLNDLDSKPDAINPITLNDFTIQQKGKVTLKAGFYNKNTQTATNAIMGISDCINEEGQTMTGVPTVASSYGDIQAGDSKAYNLIINLKGLNEYVPGTYTCTFIVYNQQDATQIYDSKSNFLEVTG